MPQQEVANRIGDGASPAAQSRAFSRRVARIRLEDGPHSSERGDEGDSRPSLALDALDITPPSPAQSADRVIDPEPRFLNRAL